MFPPKIIHMIWFGILPVDYEINIVRWAAMNPAFKIRFYIDRNQAFLRQKFKRLANLEVIDYADFYKHADQNLKLNYDFLQAELDIENGGNFAAASDILRLDLLYYYGGYYIDTDIYCIRDIGLIDLPLGFAFNARDGRISTKNGDGTCNNLLAAVPQSDIVQKIRQRVNSEYQSLLAEHRNLRNFFITKRNPRPQLLKLFIHITSGAGPMGRIATKIAPSPPAMEKLKLPAHFLASLLVENHNSWLPSGQENVRQRQQQFQQSANVIQGYWRSRSPLPAVS